MNKKGSGNDIMFLWMFFVWVIIGGAIIIGVLVFYSAQTDVRFIEAEILSKKITNCMINDEGFVKLQYFDKPDDLIKDCKLNLEIIKKSNYFYILANFTKLSDWQDFDNPKISKQLEIGNKDLIVQCEIRKSTEKADKFGICMQRNIYTLYNENNERKGGILQLFVAVNNK